MTPWAAYLGIGALVGFAAGLLGIGGGVVMVPLLVLVFTGQGLPPEHVLHVALGTAMAAMVFTSVAPSNLALFCSSAMSAWFSPSRSSLMLSSGVEMESGSASRIAEASLPRETISRSRAPA